MSNELPLAVVTVRFEQPVTGIQLAALIQQIASRTSTFVVEYRYYDGHVMSFGHRSDYLSGHVRVTPSLDGPAFFSPEENYAEVKVTSHSWDESVHTIRYDNQAVIDAVKRLATNLSAAYETALTDGFPRYVERKGRDNDMLG